MAGSPLAYHPRRFKRKSKQSFGNYFKALLKARFFVKVGYMTIQEIHNLAIKMGRDSDFRGEGSPKIYEKMAQVGIGTIVGMHMSEEHKKEAETANINVIVAGHMSSDSLGMNMFLDELEKKGIEIIPCSGFIRISRNK